MKLTGRQTDALRELGWYGNSGAMQHRLKAGGVSRSSLLALASKGLAEWQTTTIGLVGWFITDAGRRALEQKE